jgi:hypothetical protein
MIILLLLSVMGGAEAPRRLKPTLPMRVYFEHEAA